MNPRRWGDQAFEQAADEFRADAVVWVLAVLESGVVLGHHGAPRLGARQDELYARIRTLRERLHPGAAPVDPNALLRTPASTT